MLKRGRQEAMSFDPVAPDVPEWRQGNAYPKGLFPLPLGGEPLQTGAHLLVIRLQLRQ